LAENSRSTVPEQSLFSTLWRYDEFCEYVFQPSFHGNMQKHTVFLIMVPPAVFAARHFSDILAALIRSAKSNY
jgi:hypothetical protein